VLRIAYGHIVESDDDKYVLLAEELAHITTAAIQPGKWLVDSFPYRQSFAKFVCCSVDNRSVKYLPHWIPGGGFQRWASKARTRSNELIYSPLHEAKQKIVRRNLFS
jgi:hypothetical protein